MAQRPLAANHPDAAYQNNPAFAAYDPSFTFNGDQHPNADAAWPLNANALHLQQQQQQQQQDLSRAHSHSPAWPDQQHHQRHLAARPTSAVQSHNDLLRRSPLQAPYGAASPYNAYQAQSPHALQQHQPQYQSPLQQQQPYQHTHQQYQAHQQQQHQHQQSQQYDPALLGVPGHAFSSYANQTSDSHTIAPQSLEHNTHLALKPDDDADKRAAPVSAAITADQSALAGAIPDGQVAGLFTIIDFDKLVRATNSERISNFATIGRTPQEWAITRAALPAYTPRRSRNALKSAAGNDPVLLAKISGARKSKSKLALKHKASGTATSKSAANPGSVELTSDESSDYDSDQSSDSGTDDSPLAGRKRPDTPKEGIEYDIIDALWRSKRKVVDANDVRKALVAFWDIVKTVRDRWKADTAAVTQAEEKGPKGELPYLRQRVKDQRDMIETAFKTALKYGNRTILETLSENTPLIFLCYQFLLDRHKADDINGPLARAILEVMALFSSLTEDKLEKTHLVKILPRIIKSGDAKTQFYAKQITAKAAASRTAGKVAATDDKKAALTAGATKPDAGTGTKRPGSALNAPTDSKKPAISATKAAAAKVPVESSTTTAKKRLLGDDAPKNPAKKLATTNGASEVKSEASATTTTAAATKAKPASKLTSGLFSGLQSAAKKPGTSVKGVNATGAIKDAVSKPSSATTPAPAPVPARPTFSLADTMKSISKPKEEKPPPKEEKEVIKETPEQKAKRLKKEARGHLRVHWKAGEDLVSIREFTHDPEEDMGHDSSQTRDVADLKGEGRMFKQQHNSMMDIDEDDDEAVAPAKEVKMVDWSEPHAIDFSDVDEEERKRNYSRFADGHLKPDSPESAERENYEANTLMVFYSQYEDIPPSPREPAEAIVGDAKAPIVSFGAVDQKFVDRAREVRTMQQSVSNNLSTHASSQAPIDFDKLRNVLSKTNGTTQPAQQSTPSTAQPSVDIMSIIAKINQGQQTAQQQPQQQFTAPNQAWAGILPTQQPQPPQAAQQPPVPGQPDITAILAQLKAAQQPTAAPQSQPQSQPQTAPLPLPNFNAATLDPGFMAFVAQQQAAAAAAAQQQTQSQSQGQGQGQNKQNPQSAGIYENPDRKRWREGDDSNSGPDADVYRSYKTKACKYYLEGKCVKGDKCTYIHAGE